MKTILAVAILFFTCSTAFAATTSTRNASVYVLGSSATHTITTNPIQPYQPVYAWRTHTRPNGSNGDFGQSGDLIGYTDDSGTLEIHVNQIPLDFSFCGYFSGERVAVGSPSSPKSNALSFTIVTLIGPRPPLDVCG